MANLYAVWLPEGNGDYLAKMPQLVANGHHVAVQKDGHLVILTGAALAILRDLSEETDGHYDGLRVWIGGDGHVVTDGETPTHSQRMHMRYGCQLSNEQHQIVYGQAYRDGHSGGFHDVEVCYIDLVDMVERLLGLN